MQKKIIKFVRHWHVYQKGEVASFPVNQCERLINAGYAEYQITNTEAKIKQQTISNDAANLKAMTSAPNTKDIKPDQNKKKGRGRPSKKKTN